MSKTYPPKRSPKPRKPSIPPKRPQLLALSILLALAATCSMMPCYADEPKDSNFLRIQLGYGSTSEIPGTGESSTVLVPCPEGKKCDPPLPTSCTETVTGALEDSKPWSLGLTWSTFLAEDFSLDLSAGVPLGDAGQDTLSAGVALHYYFDSWFVPLAVTYRGDFDTIALGSGIGWEYQTPGRTVFTVAATGNYLTDTEVSDPWIFGVVGTIGWRLGNE